MDTSEKIYKIFADELLKDLYDEISSNSTVNFESGLSGIGWGIEYLVQNKFKKANTDIILSDIDDVIMEININRMNDLSIKTGSIGILVYVYTRLNARCKNRIMPFNKEYRAEVLNFCQEKNKLLKDNFSKIITEEYINFCIKGETQYSTNDILGVLMGSFRNKDEKFNIIEGNLSNYLKKMINR